MPTVKANGVNLYYEEAGPAEGRPVVLVAGWTANSYLFKDFSGALASRYRVVSLDMRGHGRSDKPPPGQYSLEAFCADIRGLLLALDIRQPAVLFGQSMGGMIVMDYALRYPDEVAALVIANSKAQLMGSLKDRLVWETIIFMYRLSPAKFFGRMIPSFFHHPAPPQVIEGLLQMSLQTPKPIGVDVIRSVARVNLTGELSKIRVPTLVFASEFDQPDIRVGTEAIAAGIPNARLEMVPDCGHLPFIEQQELVVQKIMDFLG